MPRLKKLISFIVILLLCSTPFALMAQGIDPGCDPQDPLCPIDGGISLLIAAGLGVGARKIIGKKAE
jgi:hypothetical protein